MRLLIQAVEGRQMTLLDAAGRVLRGRFAGRDKAGSPLPDGELVDDHHHYRRAILRGDLALVAEQEHS